jgi:hypothetical protein
LDAYDFQGVGVGVGVGAGVAVGTGVAVGLAVGVGDGLVDALAVADGIADGDGLVTATAVDGVAVVASSPHAATSRPTTRSARSPR